MVQKVVLVILIIIIVSNCKSVKKENFESIIDYLFTYGYLNVSEEEVFSSTEKDPSYLTALNLLQTNFNLTQSNETIENVLKLISSPRCGVKDMNVYNTHYILWGNSTITWDSKRTTSIVQYLIEKAFNLWSKYTNLNIIHSPYNENATIYISFGGIQHWDFKKRARCRSHFDGEGMILGHAEFPSLSMHSEIHIDNAEQWYYGMDPPYNSEEKSLFAVLVHEIGHALGIRHSNDKNAIMYPIYTEKIFQNSNYYDLHIDDINAIQSLYGKNIKSLITTTTKAPTTTKVSTTKGTQKPITTTEKTHNKRKTSSDSSPDLCSLKNVNKFLIVRKKLYIFYNKWVWVKNLNEKNFDPEPYLITDWLNFLPKNFLRMNGIYQRPNGNIVLFIDNVSYNIKFPSLELENIANPYHQNSITYINGAVSTNSGQTYIFHKNNSFIKIDECRFFASEIGSVDDEFPGIPNNIESVFKYTNGRLYFFINDYYYEFDEFSKSVVKAEKFNLSMFNIDCPNINLYEQLKILLSKILYSQ